MSEEIILKAFENPWVQGIVNKIFTKGKEVLNDLNEKEKIQWRIAFEKYLKKTNESFSKTKTLLYRDTPVDIYDFYECISLLKDRKTHIDTQEINNILNEGHKILITGLGGVGKTILMKHLFLNAIKTTNLIPVLIELRRINGKTVGDFDLKKYIIDTLKDYNLNLSEKYYDYTFDEGYYIFLFDGYDEVEDKLKITLKAEISKFALKYNKNYFIISSRPSSEFISWENFLELKSLHLNKKQAINLINKLKYNEIVKTKFVHALKNGLFESYSTFASTPLLLIIMFLTFEANATIPNKLNDFYEQAFSVLFYKHDATKDCYSRERKSGLEYVDFKKAFSCFCFKTYFNEKYSFSHKEIIEYINIIDSDKLGIPKFKAEMFLHDLMASLCLIVEEGMDFKFVHRSFQEYFAAFYFKDLLDEQQKSFFLVCLKNKKINFFDKFFLILLELQKDRFIKNIVFPYVEHIKNTLEKSSNFREEKDRKIFLYFMGNFKLELVKDETKKKIISFILDDGFEFKGICFFSDLLNLEHRTSLDDIDLIFKEIEKEKIPKRVFKASPSPFQEISLLKIFEDDVIWNQFKKKCFENILLSWSDLELYYEENNKKLDKNLGFDDFLKTL